MTKNKGVQKRKVCLRPDRHYSILKFDLIKHGWEESPKVCYGLNRCRLTRDKEGRIWIHNMPTLEKLESEILKGEEFLQISKERQAKIRNIRNHLKKVNEDLKERKPLDLLVAELPSLKRDYENLMSYIFHAQFIEDKITMEFLTLLRSFLPIGVANAYILSLMRSDYVRESIEIGIAVRDKKDFSFPLGHPPIVREGQIDCSVVSPMEGKVMEQLLSSPMPKRAVLAKDFIKYRLIFPLLFQWSEEFMYISESIQSHINAILVKIADYLINQRIMRDSEEILSLTLQKILEIYNSTKPDRQTSAFLSR